MKIEKIQSFSAKYYDHKIKTDLEFYAKEKKRVNEYMKNRYATDEELKEQKKQSYHRRKSMMIPNNQVQVY